MTNILQVLLGLALVNYLMFDVVFADQSKLPAKSAQLHKALAIARTTAAAFLLTLVVSTLLEQFVFQRFTSRLLSTVSFILILATVLHGIALVMGRRHLPLAFVPGIFLTLIFVNCMVMGVTMPLDTNSNNLNDIFVSGLARCAGFALVLVLFTLLRGRLAGADIPAAFRGTATTLLAAALLSMTFMGFAGLG